MTGLRDKDRSVRGLHEPIITDELFERVQEVRGWRARVVKAGRPSPDYVLRKLLYCERCGHRMHGTRGSRGGIRRCQCSTRRHGGDCTQPIGKADPLEDQLVAWLADFQPDAQLRAATLSAVASQAASLTGNDPARRRELVSQLERLQDLYVIGDLSRDRYVLKRQALEEELQRLGSPADPGLDQAADLLENFARFWEIEPDPNERRKLLATLFDRVWQDAGTIVAVRHHPSFAAYFAAQEAEHPARTRGDNDGSDGTRTRDLRRDRPAL